MKKPPLIIIAGPTAVGKTDSSIALAKEIGGEIISADSMQIYKYMDIGSAKVTKEEMCGVPHYLIDELDPADEFNVVIFQKMAREAMKKIYANGHIPIVAGGTGFYIQALLYDIDFDKNDGDFSYRRQLEKTAAEHGEHMLHEMLRDVDPESAEAIHENNSKRVIRALEYFYQTGNPISKHNQEQHQKESPYDFAYFVLNRPREELYERINLRVDMMMEKGLLEETKRLYDMGYTRNMVSMQGLGYKELLDYYNGVYTLEEAVEIIKRDTRHFAKRQLTWFRRQPDITWVNMDKENLLDVYKNGTFPGRD